MNLAVQPEMAVEEEPPAFAQVSSQSTDLPTFKSSGSSKPNMTSSDISNNNMDLLRTNSVSRKRRFSFNHKNYENAIRRKRSYSCVLRGDNKNVLPTKFLLGGTIDDPLNLKGLSSSEQLDALKHFSPVSSPLWHSQRKNVEVVIPPNITDPLNLNVSDNEINNCLAKRRKRHRHRKKDDLNEDPLPFDAPIKIDVNCEVDSDMASKVLSEPIGGASSFLFPLTNSRRRRRTMSECAADMVSSCELINNDKLKTDKTISPKVQPSNSSKKLTPEKILSAETKQKPARKTSNVKFIHGNYNRYYGYRNSPDVDDVRLVSFKQEWFNAKDVLDIGCNVGHVTMAVAKNFLPKKMVGLDIDSNLISAARKNIRHYIDSQQKHIYPVSSTVAFGPLAPPPFGTEPNKISFPENLIFKQANYVLSSDEQLKLVKEEYDTILALSITKWIHLNNGDDGVKLFFKRIYKHLRPGGTLILEPQPWASYKKRKNLSSTIQNNFRSIKLKPEQFREYLLGEVGFLKCEVIDLSNHKAKGFRRPIQVYSKSGYSDKKK
ncbi:hypothetical protein SNE40_014019 [Patella caerulea]|uniref:RNA methyltransferase n=1 Tax=Patella caerulea TaxID=87958 RepID=A0AAN8PGM3_PATCE